jgi:hypothetical protein
VSEPTVFERVVAEAICFGVCPEGAHEAGENLCYEAATAGLHALATHPEARSALVRALTASEDWWVRDAAKTADDESLPMPGIRTWVLVDTFLAAIDPKATDA